MSDTQDPLDGANATDIGIVALRTELASVSVSPDFSNRVLTSIDWNPAPLEAGATLESVLSGVSVSPAFAVRVRSAIEEQSARRSWLPLNWRWAVPLGAVAVGLVVAVVMLRSDVKPLPVTSIATSGGAGQTPPAEVTIRPAAPTVTRTAPSVTLIQPRRVDRSKPVARLAAADPLSEVITDQPAVIRQLWARVAPDAALASEDPAAGVFVTAGEIAIPPIEVNPIVVKSLGDPAAAAPGSTPIIRRATAEQAERSPK